MYWPGGSPGPGTPGGGRGKQQGTGLQRRPALADLVGERLTSTAVVQVSAHAPRAQRATVAVALGDQSADGVAVELAARSEVTLPLFSHMTDADQDRVVAALAEEL